MSTDLVLTDDGLTVEFDGADECSDLTADEAEAVTGRIRRWVNDFPVADVVLAFRGRVWIALAYDNWAEWCECELGGLKLPAPKRREVVSELANEGMSNVAIGYAVGVSAETVRRDVSTSTNVEVDEDRKVLGQDGRERVLPQPKPAAPQTDVVIDAEIVCRDCDGYGCETCVPEDVADALNEHQAQGSALEALQRQIDQAPQRKSPKPPIAKTFGSATYELKRAVERTVRLADDDRFKKNKDQIADVNLSDLIRVRDAINGVIQQLEG